MFFHIYNQISWYSEVGTPQMNLQQFMMLTNIYINQSFKYEHLRLLLYLEVTHLSKLYSTFMFKDYCKNIQLEFF